MPGAIPRQNAEIASASAKNKKSGSHSHLHALPPLRVRFRMNVEDEVRRRRYVQQHAAVTFNCFFPGRGVNIDMNIILLLPIIFSRQMAT